MITILTKIFTNIVTTIYQYIWFALLAAVLFMFLYLFAGEHGWKESFKVWLGSFRRRSAFRRVFLLALYMILVLFRTLLNRELWLNPLSDIFGGWGLYTENGVFTTEAIENFLLLLPFILLLFWAKGSYVYGKRDRCLSMVWAGIKIAFCFSLAIECIQLFFRLGTFQFSDLCYNTLGGGVGALIYNLGRRGIRSLKSKNT